MLRRKHYEASSSKTYSYYFNISPKNDWVLIAETYYNGGTEGDSAKLKMFPMCDTAQTVLLLTIFKSEEASYLSVFIDNSNPNSTPSHYTVNTWSPNQDTVYFYVRGSNYNSTWDSAEYFFIDISSITTGIGEKVPNSLVPKRLKASNYPNPFNPVTTIRYTLPVDNFVSINIYNLKGELIKALVQKKQNAGTYTVKWNGKNNKGLPVANGKYFYQVVSGDLITVKKMILLK